MFCRTLIDKWWIFHIDVSLLEVHRWWQFSRYVGVVSREMKLVTTGDLQVSLHVNTMVNCVHVVFIDVQLFPLVG